MTVSGHRTIWKDQYLSKLANVDDKMVTEINIEDEVLLEDQFKSRYDWISAIITNIRKGRDGIIRTVKINKQGQEYWRPRNKIKVHKLELLLGL